MTLQTQRLPELQQRQVSWSARVSRWLGRLALVAVLLLGFWLRVYHLALQAAMGDDAFTLVIGQQSLPALLRQSQNEPHPPLFYVLLHYWQMAAGPSEFSGRFLGLWFGVAGLAALYLVGRRLGGSWLGLLAALLGAANPFLIAFGQQVRMYTLAVLLCTCSVALLGRALEGSGRWRWLAWFGSSLLAVYSHFFSFFVLGAEIVFVAWWAIRRRRWPARGWLASLGVIALCYAPWIIVAHRTLLTYTNGLVRRASLPEIARTLLPTFVTGDANGPLPLWAAAGVVALLAAGLLLPLWPAKGLSARRVEGARLVLCWLVAPVLAVWAISLLRPMFFERYMVVILPAFLLALAAGVLAIARRAGAVSWLAGAVLLALPLAPAAGLLPPYYATVLYATGPQIRQMLAFVSSSARPHAAFVVNLAPSDPMYRYYRPAQEEFFVPNPAPGAQAATDATLRSILAKHPEVWLTPWDFDHTAYVEKWLDQHAFRVDQHWFANAEVIRYESPLPPTAASPSTALFQAPQARIALRGVELYDHAVRAGSPVLFSLFWQTDAPIAQRYKVFAHLLDSHSHVITQRDDEPVANARPTTTWRAGEIITDNYALLVPRSAAPGQYQIEVGLYGLTNPQRLHLTTGADRVLLGTITVTSP